MTYPVTQSGNEPTSTTLGALPTGVPQQQPAQPIIIQQPASQYFTADDLAAARQQEKDKLYGRLTKAEETLNAFRAEIDQYKAEREAAQQVATKAQQDAAEAARKEAEAKLSVQELVAAKQAEWDAQLNAQKADFERAKILMEKEREYLALKAYAQKRIAEETAADSIIPDLLEYIDGNTEEEIEASITRAKEKTANILAGMTGSQGRTVSPGVSPTGLTPGGPLDNLSGQRQYSLDELKGMGQVDYAQLRKALGIDKAGNNRGLFG